MLGAANETRETIRETRDFVKTLGPDSVQFSICTPLPGTKFWDECETNGWLHFDEWEEFDGVSGGVLDFPHLSRHEIREAIQNSYLDYYSSPAHIKQRLRRMLEGPERKAQFVRNLWLMKRLFSVLGNKIKAAR
jgi:radical SAM superfamily enzyme YgiQ (UPF0313 family)